MVFDQLQIILMQHYLVKSKHTIINVRTIFFSFFFSFVPSFSVCFASFAIVVIVIAVVGADTNWYCIHAFNQIDSRPLYFSVRFNRIKSACCIIMLWRNRIFPCVCLMDFWVCYFWTAFIVSCAISIERYMRDLFFFRLFLILFFCRCFWTKWRCSSHRANQCSHCTN